MSITFDLRSYEILNNIITSTPLFHAANHTTTNVRLLGGSGPHEGRVEVDILGDWVPVCKRSWDLLIATVVCRQLRYSRAGAIPSQTSTIFGPGRGSVWLSIVKCTGNETSLSQCTSRIDDSSCTSHSQDAGVICSGISNYIYSDWFKAVLSLTCIFLQTTRFQLTTV